MEKSLDMTSGNPYKQIYTFTVPLFIANIFQQLYIITDSIIVGRFIGVKAFAAIGAANFYYSLVINIAIGLAQGFGTYYAQLFGARNFSDLKRSIARTVFLSSIICISLTAISLALTTPMLRLVGTPSDIIDASAEYLYWALSALSVTFAYNFASCLLRAVGNSKTPLISVILSSTLNVAFDFLLISQFHMGVNGAALASTIATLVSFIYCYIKLMKLDFACFTVQDLKPNKSIDKGLFRLGIPLAIRNIIISAGSMLLQGAINIYGTFFVAGMTAASKFSGIMCLVSSALDASAVVFVGQNYGAGKLDRVSNGIKMFSRIAIISSVAIAILTVIFGKEIIGIFISGNVDNLSEVILVGYKCLIAYSICLPALYLLFVYRSGLQGLGNATVPMVSGLVELLFRTASIILLTSFIGEWGVLFADGAAWIGAGIFLIINYKIVYKKRCRDLLWRNIK